MAGDNISEIPTGQGEQWERHIDQRLQQEHPELTSNQRRGLVEATVRHGLNVVILLAILAALKAVT